MPVTPLVGDGESVATADLVRLKYDSVTLTSGDADGGGADARPRADARRGPAMADSAGRRQ